MSKSSVKVARNKDGGYLSALEEKDSSMVGVRECWLANIANC